MNLLIGVTGSVATIKLHEIIVAFQQSEPDINVARVMGVDYDTIRLIP